MKRVILPVLALVLASAGCRTTNPWRVTWLEAVSEAPRPDVHVKIFWYNQRWKVGECSLVEGSHVTLHSGPVYRFTSGIALIATGDGARFEYGITMVAADGTTLAHFPSSNGGEVYVADIRPNVQAMSAPIMPISPDVYDRVARVVIHATCRPRRR